MIWKAFKSRLFVIVILLFGAFGGVVYITGLLDFIPHLRTSAKSPDGELIVKVYQKRLFPRPIFAQMGAIAKVYDKNDNLIYEKTIYSDDDWDDTVGNAYKEISFIGDEIHTTPGAYTPSKAYIIKRSDLK